MHIYYVGAVGLAVMALLLMAQAQGTAQAALTAEHPYAVRLSNRRDKLHLVLGLPSPHNTGDGVFRLYEGFRDTFCS
jgi:hypothetical protein